MAVKISSFALVNYGASGSPYGSEVLFNLAAGPNYLSQATVTLANAGLGAALPSWLQFARVAGANVEVQYTPDSGVTWRSLGSGSGALVYADTGGSIRLFNNGAAGVNIFVVPIKQ